MNAININLALIAIQILEIDTETNTANINFAYAEPNANGQAKKWHRMDMENIFITGRAVKNLLDEEQPDYQLQTVYVSHNKSRDRQANPFCLSKKHDTDDQGNSIEKYYLKCVEENGSYVVTGTMPDGAISKRRVWRKNKPDYAYARWIDMYENGKAYHEERKSKESAI